MNHQKLARQGILIKNTYKKVENEGLKLTFFEFSATLIHVTWKVEMKRNTYYILSRYANNSIIKNYYSPDANDYYYTNTLNGKKGKKKNGKIPSPNVEVHCWNSKTWFLCHKHHVSIFLSWVTKQTTEYINSFFRFFFFSLISPNSFPFPSCSHSFLCFAISPHKQKQTLTPLVMFSKKVPISNYFLVFSSCFSS